MPLASLSHRASQRTPLGDPNRDQGVCSFPTWQAIRATQQRDRARNAEIAAKAETEARQTADVSRMHAEQARYEATKRLELAQLERDKAQESEMMARDAHERALEAKQQAEANLQEAERQRQLAERSEQMARIAEKMALVARNDAVEAAARSQGAEDVVAELVRSMLVNAHHLSDVEQNLDARYALHWAMAALAQITNSRDERISNLDECIRLAEQRVDLLEAEFPDSGRTTNIAALPLLPAGRPESAKP